MSFTTISPMWKVRAAKHRADLHEAALKLKAALKVERAGEDHMCRIDAENRAFYGIPRAASWHNEANDAERRDDVRRFFQKLIKRFPDESADTFFTRSWIFASIIEMELYKSAASREEYLCKSTIRLRVARAVQRRGIRNGCKLT